MRTKISVKDRAGLLGGAGESKFFAKLMELEYFVYVPLVDIKGVDCIATKNHTKFLQFQVKTSTKGDDYALIRADIVEDYYFVFMCVITNSTWIIPAKDFVKLAAKDTPDKKGTKRYRISLTKSKDKKRYPNPIYDRFRDKLGLDLIK